MIRRRRTPRRRRVLTPGINLTPLLDVIFNLIFFFLLATTLRSEVYETRIKLPKSSSAEKTEENPNTIRIEADGSIYFAGRLVSEEQLERQLGKLAAGGVEEVAIDGDEAVNFGRVYAVVDICRRAGLSAVSLNAESKAEPPGSSVP